MNTFCHREQIPAFKIKGQKRPYIDQELQFQLPGIEDYQEPIIRHRSQVYSYYLGDGVQQFHPSLTIPIDYKGLEQAIADANQSYTVWKKLHQQILEVAHKVLSLSEKESSTEDK